MNGKEIMDIHENSGFVDEEWAARSIDLAIEKAALEAKRKERERIEKLVANMGEPHLRKAIRTCRFLNGKANENVDLFVTTATFMCSCPMCSEPMTGNFDSDENQVEDESNYYVKLKCVNCAHEVRFKIHPEIEGRDEKVSKGT